MLLLVLLIHLAGGVSAGCVWMEYIKLLVTCDNDIDGVSWLSVARELAAVVFGLCIDYFPLDWDGCVNTLTNMDTLVYSVYELDGLSRLA